MIYHTSSVSETEDLGASLAQTLRPGSFIALYGDLGVGKTAFVRGAAKVLCPGENVCSPFSFAPTARGASWPQPERRRESRSRTTISIFVRFITRSSSL